MNQRWIDYYSIMEVSWQAAREVIEARYRALSKLYHPDINHAPDAEEKMKMINLAWDVLKDEHKRSAFHREWMMRNRLAAGPAQAPAAQSYRPQRRTQPPPEALEPRRAVSQYFRSIMARDYRGAYVILSERDKRNIPIDSFIRWQSSVACSYRIENFLILSAKQYDRFPLEDVERPAVRYSIEITERDLRTGESSRYRVIKFAVREKDGWHIHLGYRDIEYVVEQFSVLAGASGEALARTTDAVTGLPNRRGFLEKCKPEAYRSARYGRKCVLGIAAVRLGRNIDDPETRRRIQQQVAFSLRATVRLIDIVGALEDARFCVLLIETDAREARRASHRIAKKVEQDILACFDMQVGLSWTLADFHGDDMEEALRALERKGAPRAGWA